MQVLDSAAFSNPTAAHFTVSFLRILFLVLFGIYRRKKEEEKGTPHLLLQCSRDNPGFHRRALEAHKSDTMRFFALLQRPLH